MIGFTFGAPATWVIGTYLLFLPVLVLFSLPLLFWGRNRVSSVGWIVLGLNTFAVGIVAKDDIIWSPVIYPGVGLLLMIGGVFLWPWDAPWWRP